MPIPIDGDQYHHLNQTWKRVVMLIDRQAQIINQAASFSVTPEEGHPLLKLTHYANAGFIQYCNDVDDNKLPPKFQAGYELSIRVGDYA